MGSQFLKQQISEVFTNVFILYDYRSVFLNIYTCATR
jgi:hypothetical protein